MSRGNAYFVGFLGLVGFLALWEMIWRIGGAGLQLNLPPPSGLPAAFYAEFASGIWLEKVVDSLRHYAVGLGLGSLLGVTAGTAVALSPSFEAAQSWIARIIRPIPPPAWIPFALMWFGITETAAAFIISIGVFWINYFTAYGAVRAVEPDLIEVARAFGHASFYRRLIKVILPGATPGIFSGLRAGLGQGWMTVVASELFGIPGIGQRMYDASGVLATNIVLVYMLTIALLYSLTDAAFMAVHKRVLAWRPSSR